MGTKMEKLKKKSAEIVENKKELAEQKKINSSDLASIKELLDGFISDEDDLSSISTLDRALSCDAAIIESKNIENEKERKETLVETESSISALEDNLNKLQKIEKTTDLVRDFSNADATKKRIEELENIRLFLEGENNKHNVGDNMPVQSEALSFNEELNNFIEEPGKSVEPQAKLSDADENISVPPTFTLNFGGGSQSIPPKKDARELADELDYELSFGNLLSKIREKKETSVPEKSAYDFDAAKTRENEFIQSLKVKVNPIIVDKKNTSSNDSDDDQPNIGARIKRHNEWDIDRESHLSNIKDKFASLLHRNSNENFEHSGNPVAKAQSLIDNYCNKVLGEVLTESKKRLRLSDSVEFQDVAEFGFRYTLVSGEDPSGVNGYFDPTTKKSYVNNSGPHPVKTAVHEQNHLLSCNEIKDFNNNVIEKRSGVVIVERDDDGYVERKNVQINEALTEYFTKKMMGDKYPSNPNVGYIYNMMRIEKMEAGFGYDTLQKAYYLNQPHLLKEKYEAVMGKGTWETFSRAFDVSLSPTVSYEVRKKAEDYANICATEFAIRTKGNK